METKVEEKKEEILGERTAIHKAEKPAHEKYFARCKVCLIVAGIALAISFVLLARVDNTLYEYRGLPLADAADASIRAMLITTAGCVTTAVAGIFLGVYTERKGEKLELAEESVAQKEQV